MNYYLAHRRNVDEANKRICFGPFDTEADARKFLADRIKFRRGSSIPDLLISSTGPRVIADLYAEHFMNFALRAEDV